MAGRDRAADALLEACRWAPDDDAPRLVWADAVGGERGELVVIQCDLARGDLAPAAAAARRRRERELLEAHGAAWAGLAGFPCEFELRRGFVEAIVIDAPTFTRHGEELFDRAPLLRSLTAIGLTVKSGDPLHELRALFESPAFWRLHALDLHRVGVQSQAYDYDPGFEGRGDDAARLLVDSGALAHLDGLGLAFCGLTAAGAHHLVASGELSHLEQLWLREHDLGVDAILDVLGRVPRVRSLDLYGATAVEEILPALPPVVELHLSGAGDRALAALGQSCAAPTLEKLGLSIGTLEGAAAFGALPRLRELDLRDMRLDDPERAARDLAAAAPALRRLRLPADTPASALRLLARALGPHLEELDVRHGRHAPGLVGELAAHVAGVVRWDLHHHVEPLL
ncbi:MAG TPA: hypothetical protein VNO30_48090 [Kofleriaceae bacterium]|nr:hypothetical protein [Kofleriaceae bacterium]